MTVGFAGGSVVDVEQIDDQDWKLLRDIKYEGYRDLFEIPVGEKTDFASVPRIFVWFLPRYGRYTKAAILHDYLWRNRVPKGMSRLDADGLFRQAMRELGVPFLRRWLMWAAVRWAALFKKDGRREWIKEAPRVVLMTLLGLIFISLPVVPILASLVLFYIAEWICWIPLKLNHLFCEKKGLPTKKVNKPSITWKL